MHHGNPVVEGRQRCCEARRRVPLDEDQLRPLTIDQRRQALQCASGDVLERLTTADDVEVVVRRDPEEAVHLVEHLAVLTCHDDDRVQMAGLLHRLDHRSDLDGLGARSVDGHDFSRHPHTPDPILQVSAQAPSLPAATLRLWGRA